MSIHFLFLVLCFTGLIRLFGFFLMGEVMELPCNESIINQMRSEIKEDYSIFLLSLSSGRRIIGNCLLAFGENNKKGRIMNILNYKKPAFWVVIAAIIAVVAICVGLVNNPQKEPLTVEDYANQFMEQQITTYEKNEGTDVKIIDSKITRLEKIASFDELLSSPVEIWSLEYRLKPDDISKAFLPGGMNEVDGWITENSSMGKPMLIFSYEGSKPQYLGYAWSGEGDFTTVAGRETALRMFLEGMDLLPNETYSDTAEKAPVPSLNELLTSELTANLESVGVDTSTLTRLEIIDPKVNDPSYYLISSTEGIQMYLDADRNVVSIVNFIAEDNGLSAQDNVAVLLDKVRKLLNLGDDYICSDGYTSFTFTRQYPNGLKNIYESVNVQVSSVAPAVTVLRRFNVPPNRIEPALTETEAIKAAENNEYAVNNTEVPLICYRPPDSETGEVRLAYKIYYGTASWVIIDAENGDVLGIDALNENR